MLTIVAQSGRPGALKGALKMNRKQSEKKRPSVLRRVAVGLSAVAAVGGAALAVGVSTASAEPYYSTMVPSSDWLDVAVSGGSTAPGAPIIQWWADGGAEQQWHIPNDGTMGEIINQNSNMCITTDGVAGDQLYQEPCTNASDQMWVASSVLDGPQNYYNPQSGLVMDVYGYDMWAGGSIDAWYSNGAPNQNFWSTIGYYQ
jgi:Ricin-type beta-trefoil lectin domain